MPKAPKTDPTEPRPNRAARRHQAEPELEVKPAEEVKAAEEEVMWREHQAGPELEVKPAEHPAEPGPDHFPSATSTTGTLCGRKPGKGERIGSSGDPTCPGCRELLMLPPLEVSPGKDQGRTEPVRELATVQELAELREREHQPAPVRPVEGTELPEDPDRCVALLPVYLGPIGGIGYLRCAHPKHGEALLCAAHQRLFLVTGPA